MPFSIPLQGVEYNVLYFFTRGRVYRSLFLYKGLSMPFSIPLQGVEYNVLYSFTRRGRV